ncbi:hypothetical protein BDF20DRAFT_912625 [Mycotypha africana]|uniref:uncharacterized protein n=1 Tax=Mycotypha africana TaxID=64632 RepID=UPI0022FFF000|nr:uncharacterized protein BDF20DRAFT_912625 [Mycotypha africana]KAI8982471.1 hypothetical protein BDF20DRAFT_912625 [Mycotypha africana]
MPFIDDSFGPIPLFRQNAFFIVEGTNQSDTFNYSEEVNINTTTNTVPTTDDITDLFRTLSETSAFYQLFVDSDNEYHNRINARQTFAPQQTILSERQQNSSTSNSSSEDEGEEDAEASDVHYDIELDREVEYLSILRRMFALALSKGSAVLSHQYEGNSSDGSGSGNIISDNSMDKYHLMLNKLQASLALLALLTEQYGKCPDYYLQQFLDPNGDYDRRLAIVAAAVYDGILYEDQGNNKSGKSCRDLLAVAEDLYGYDWLNDFYDDEDDSKDAFKKMLEKLTFISKIRFKLKEQNWQMVTR